MRFWGLLAAFFALLVTASPSAAREVIRHFHAHAAVQKDGSVVITETIRVRAERREIKRGIYRTIPTRYRGDAGETFNLGFEFLEATRNGHTEESRVERQANGVNIRLGSAASLLARGEHTYRLRYRLARGVARFDTFDELYWNVTGNGWDFPIERASATIRLPEAGGFTQVASYSGPQGERGVPARIARQDAREIRVEAARRLAPREGLTVAVGFPKGVITPLSEAEKLERKIADLAPPIAGLIGFLVIAAYYYHAWRTVGRDPRSGTVVPLFAPPDDLSPAAMRYLTRQQMDHRGLTAALVDSAIKGHVELREDGGGFFTGTTMEIVRLPDTRQLRPLDAGEQAMLGALALPGGSVEMKNENHARFRAARKALEQPYKDRYEGQAFHRNLGWAFAGLLFLLAGVWIAAAGVVWAEDLASPTQLLLSVAGVSVGALFFFGRPEQGEPLRWPVITIALIAGLAGFLLGIAFIPEAFASGNIVPLLLPLVGGGLLALSGFFWMDAPTLKGRALLDRIAGFKQYLATTEQQRFDRLQPPREQLRLFERYLPHAIALGVENRWAARFEGVLAAAAQAPAERDNHAFAWYSGGRSAWSNPTGFATAIGASMTSTIASASSPPGTSSGSGGGGFSGGGIGGGGGGGW
ncbi:DUF2207 domain-containing protein [Sphingomicrobium astaxanthinifaciens]|uniref:DUF2207 domain-containing protein n=1 Tax=Sphingomicrobium astaxanthinifaciens TaxID=1227949 RepID=UPI001FCBDE6B|nr:DUF2207 domain-containing protein [Sphingomicrobium astaxanthinifaciens]MCJ7420211.1 DUF2207 domain-containing protein [Sphingomicrobium astaxanthinifaciens]